MNFIKAFNREMEVSKPNFDITGLLTKDDKVYSLGTDTKVLSTIFEILVRPFVYKIAEENALEVYEPEQQNYYPDFTLMSSKTDKQKIAVDVKTTYRNFNKSGGWKARFTLGSYTSFLRKPQKNIAFHFDDYEHHYIIGFIYTRIVKTETQPTSPLFSNTSTDIVDSDEIESDDLVQPLDKRALVLSPIKDVEYFVQEKYRIAGDIPGSGNTENIGSITASSIAELIEGNGPFADLGEEVFVDYWRNYPPYRQTGTYRNLDEYLRWKNLS
jgi:hypothetical protein